MYPCSKCLGAGRNGFHVGWEMAGGKRLYSCRLADHVEKILLLRVFFSLSLRMLRKDVSAREIQAQEQLFMLQQNSR
jgi:hypothetical protein